MDEDLSVHERTASDILDTSPDAIFLVDSTGRISYVNDRVNDLFGYEPDELLGEAIEEVVPEAIRDSHAADRDSYIEDPTTRPMGSGLDLAARRKDGSTFPVNISLSPIEIDESTYVISVVRDVTDQEALRAKYKTILEAVPDPVVVADAATGKIVESNEQVIDLLGYEPAELRGEAQTFLHPSGEADRYRNLFERHVARDQAIFTQFPDGSDLYLETEDGERVPVEINAKIFELGDRSLIVGVFRDITRRKKREDALERLHTATRDLMTATSTETVASIASETASQILDLPVNGVHLYDPTRDALVPVAWSDPLETMFDGAPPAIQRGDGLAWEAFEGGESEIYPDLREADDVLSAETEFLSELHLPLGEHGVMLISSTTASDFEATDEALAQVLADNVEAALDRVERERELETQNEKLEEFARVVSHDLRNPLNVASGRLDLLRAESESPHLDPIVDALDRMERIVGDVLWLAREGRDLGSTEFVELRSVLESSWTMAADGRRESELVVADDGGDGHWAVRADYERLCQLFENLFRNALDHGNDAVTVTVGELETGFFVEDDGPGIPADERERVFESGYTTSREGTGFGLSIVEQVVDAHGWDVRLTEGVDGGARFEITGVEPSPD